MGGFGSGRKGSRKTVESCFEVGVEQLRSAGALEPEAEGVLTWRSHKTPILEFEVSPRGVEVTQPFEELIALVECETPSGGQFWRLRCPQCDGEAWKLYLRPRAYDALGCRKCWNLTYRRSNLSGSPVRLGNWRVGRLQRKLRRLREAADAPGSRHSRKRQRRIAELQRELAEEEEAQEGRLRGVADALQERCRELGWDMRPAVQGLDKPLMDSTDEELRRIAGELSDARSPKPGVAGW